MRTFNFSTGVAAAIAALVSLNSCQKDVQSEMNQSDVVRQEMSFTAVSNGPSTRTELQHDNSIFWSVNDSIKVFQGTLGEGKFVADNQEPSAMATFKGYMEYVVGSIGASSSSIDFWGVNPYDSGSSCDGKSVTVNVHPCQDAYAGGFKPGLFPSVAKSGNSALAFYNVCGGVKLRLTQKGIRRITFSGNDEESLAGNIRVSFDANDLPAHTVVNGSNAVTLSAANEFEIGEWYYIVLLPGNLEKGFTITFETDEAKAVRRVDKAVTVLRSRFAVLDNIDEGLSFSSVEAVDLGLSVNWASVNVGAENDWEIGNRYAWGELEPKSYYDWTNYLLCTGGYYNMTRYCTNSSYGQVDGLLRLTSADDIASVTYGGGWRMPTYSEMKELIDDCSWRWTTRNGIKGYEVTGTNQNSIFIPVNGQFDESGITWKEKVYLWTSETDGTYWGHSLCASSYSVAMASNHRHDGLCVRAVYPKSSVTPDPELPDVDHIDLSASETANSYIVETAGDYMFKAVRGNSSETVGAVKGVKVLWESYGTQTTPEAGDIVYDVEYDNGNIMFSATGARGNAVIAAYSDRACSDGNVLWSWHIWCTETPSPQVYYHNAGTMMDRYLGATSCTPGDIHALGLLYQWGRKDPFLSGSTISSFSSAAASTLSWPSAVAVSTVLNDGTALEYSISHPSTFIRSDGTKLEDWHCVDEEHRNTTLWSSEKTEYDPCPAGWRVPDGGPDGVFATALGTSSRIYPSFDSSARGYHYDGLYGDDSIWYPSSGCRNPDSGLVSVGWLGYSWTCTPASGRNMYIMGSNAGSCSIPCDTYPIGFAAPVRCIKDDGAR